MSVKDGAALMSNQRRILSSWQPRFFRPPEGWQQDARAVFNAVRADVEAYASGERQARPRGEAILKLIMADNGVIEVRSREGGRGRMEHEWVGCGRNSMRHDGRPDDDDVMNCTVVSARIHTIKLPVTTISLNPAASQDEAEKRGIIRRTARQRRERRRRELARINKHGAYVPDMAQIEAIGEDMRALYGSKAASCAVVCHSHASHRALAAEKALQGVLTRGEQGTVQMEVQMGDILLLVRRHHASHAARARSSTGDRCGGLVDANTFLYSNHLNHRSARRLSGWGSTRRKRTWAPTCASRWRPRPSRRKAKRSCRERRRMEAGM